MGNFLCLSRMFDALYARLCNYDIRAIKWLIYTSIDAPVQMVGATFNGETVPIVSAAYCHTFVQTINQCCYHAWRSEHLCHFVKQCEESGAELYLFRMMEPPRPVDYNVRLLVIKPDRPADWTRSIKLAELEEAVENWAIFADVETLQLGVVVLLKQEPYQRHAARCVMKNVQSKNTNKSDYWGTSTWLKTGVQ